MYLVQSKRKLFLDNFGNLFYNCRIKSPILDVFPVKNVNKNLFFCIFIKTYNVVKITELTN